MLNIIKTTSALALLATSMTVTSNETPANASLSSPFAGFTECAAIRMKEISPKHIESDDPKHFTQVPVGWTVIGGTGGEGHPKLLICR